MGKPTLLIRVVGSSVALALSACGAEVATSPSASTPSLSGAASEVANEQSSASTGMPLAGDREYEPGTYRVTSRTLTAVPFTFTVPAGWVGENGGQTISKHPNEAGEVGINSYILSRIDSDSCADEFEPIPVGPSAADLATALTQQPGATAAEPVDLNLGGYPGQRIDLTIPGELDLAACRLDGIGLHIWEAVGGKNFVLYDGGAASVYTADVDGQRAVFSAQWKETSTADDIAELNTIMESIAFEP